MAFSINTADAATFQPTQDPILIPKADGSDATVTDNSSHNSGPQTIYNNNYGGGIYNVREGGTLNIATTTGTKTYSEIAAMIELTIKTPPDVQDPTNPLAAGDIFPVGRTGGIIYNAGTLNVGNSAVAGATALFKDNTAGIGGVITNYGTANIYGAQFQGNLADSYHAGDGAEYNESSSPEIWDTQNSGRGGAIANFDTLTITQSQFNDNTAARYGGAIYNGNGGEITIDGNTRFNGNNAGNDGGAIYNSITNSSEKSATVNINGGIFEGNSAGTSGGAIANVSNWSKSFVNPTQGVDHTTLDPLGAILEINGTLFQNNVAANQFGGAIANSSSDYRDINSITNLTNTRFISNGIKTNADGSISTNNGGGAISNSGTLTVTDSTMNSNFAKNWGGAVYNTGKADFNDVLFENNGAQTIDGTPTTTGNGGAIYNASVMIGGGETLQTDLVVKNSTFRNNAAGEGGALYNLSNATIIDTNFEGNTASQYGGAIYGGTNSNTTVIAQNQDVNFVGSLADDKTDSIHLAAGSTLTGSSAGVMNLNAHEGRNINLGAKVTGGTTSEPANVPTVNINYDNAAYTGNINFNSTVSSVNLNVHNGFATANNTISNTTITTKGARNAAGEMEGGTIHFTKDEYFGTRESAAAGHTLNNVVLDGGTISVQQGVVSNIAMNNFNLASDTNIMVDVDLANEKMDNILQEDIKGTTTFAPNAHLNISSMNMIDKDVNVDHANILFTNVNGLSVDNVDSSVSRLNGTVYQYNVNKVSGSSLNLSGDAADDVYFSFQNTFRPSDNVISKPLAQLGAFLLFDNIYRQSFANMDMLSILTRDERETLKRYNRYSNMFDDEINTFYRDKRQEDYPSVFVRGYTNLEHVRMDDGPKVSNVTYGTLIGHESGLYELGRGWDANYAVFGAYTGAHQTYNGIGVWQNGGSVGGVFTAYKGDFWTGLTANVGGWAVEAHNAFGNEHFPMLGTGVAMKTGYNWRLFDNKFIIQPSYMMSYTFVYAYSHDNAAGVHIKQDPLHAIEFVPGVKLIANNFRNGWQPYLAVNMTWMTMDGGSFWADSAVFDRYTIKPFVEYGIGVQKHHGERSTGYLQAMVRNGGRTGVALTGGFRYAIGEDILD